jgi:hypothetical protein
MCPCCLPLHCVQCKLPTSRWRWANAGDRYAPDADVACCCCFLCCCSYAAFPMLQVTQHPQCTVRLTIRDKGPAGNDYFKVGRPPCRHSSSSVSISTAAAAALDQH